MNNLNSNPSPFAEHNTSIVNEDEDDTCLSCGDRFVDGFVYYRPPCRPNHLYCRGCMKDKRLNQCFGCNQKFLESTQVLVRIAFKVDD